jgi:hypothetical protein
MSNLNDQYELTQIQVAELTFMNYKTVATVEKQAVEKFKQELEKRGITLGDLL